MSSTCMMVRLILLFFFPFFFFFLLVLFYFVLFLISLLPYTVTLWQHLRATGLVLSGEYGAFIAISCFSLG